MGKQKKWKQPTEELVWIWIGNKDHHVDKIARVLGLYLGKKYRLRCLFVDGLNIKETKDFIEELRSDKSRRFQFIAVDVGLCKQNTLMLRVDGGIKPASGIKDQDIELGDVSYIINIDNVYKHVKGKTPTECLLENYTDYKVQKKVNKIICRLYHKLDTTLQTLGGE